MSKMEGFNLFIFDISRALCDLARITRFRTRHAAPPAPRGQTRFAFLHTALMNTMPRTAALTDPTRMAALAASTS